MGDSKNYSKVITAASAEELDKKVHQEMIEQGWETEGTVIKNPDGTFSQKLVK